jgi:GNAT superfamily N-acetyltransferase
MLTVRPALRDDVPLILRLIHALAEYERLLPSVAITADDLLRDGWGRDPKFRCLIAEWDGEAVGYALFFYNYSTFRGRPGIYLEDVFVQPEFRGKGIGRALLIRVAQIAIEEKCARFEWQVLDWNTPAIEFYKSLGAQELSDWRTMRVQGDALQALAAGGNHEPSGAADA